MRVPDRLRGAVEQFRHDFGAVTRRWVREGWHTEDEVEAWRVWLRAYLQADGTTDADVLDVCAVWRGFARGMTNG